MNDFITSQMTYKRELDKIMSMNAGETFETTSLCTIMPTTT